MQQYANKAAHEAEAACCCCYCCCCYLTGNRDYGYAAAMSYASKQETCWYDAVMLFKVDLQARHHLYVLKQVLMTVVGTYARGPAKQHSGTSV